MAEMNQKYQITDEVRRLFTEAKGEPYCSINKLRGTSADYFEYLIPEIDRSLQAFEQEVGLNSAGKWKGVRLHESGTEQPLGELVAAHLSGKYFAHLDEKNDTAVVPLENYGTWEAPDGSMYYHCYTMPHLAAIRPIHIDARKHLGLLGVADLMRDARRLIDGVKEVFPIFEGLDPIYEDIRQACASFPVVLHSIGAMYFEIEAHINNPSLARSFNVAVELPPHSSVVAALEDTGCPLAYEPNRTESSQARRSLVSENIQHVDLPALRVECLEAAKNCVALLSSIRQILASLKAHDFDAYEKSLVGLIDGEELEAILSPMAFFEGHVNARRETQEAGKIY